MAKRLFRLLKKQDCTAHEIRSFLKSQPNVRRIINKKGDMGPPLLRAVLGRKSLDIIQELLIHGADVNQEYFDSSPLMAVWSRGNVEGCEAYCYDAIRLLLRYGAIVPELPFLKFVCNNKVQKTKIFVPIIETMMQYADESTKISVLHRLMSHVWNRCIPYQEEVKMENFFQAVKLLLNYGVSPNPFNLMIDFGDILRNLRFHSEHYQPYFFDLLEKVMPYFFTQGVPEDELNDMKQYIDEMINDFRNSNQHNTFHVMFSDLFVDLWNNCREQFNKMQSDKTNNNCILQTLTVTFGRESERANVTTEDVFQVLLRLAQGEYPHFKDIMRLSVKRSDMMKLYILIFSELSGKVSLLHPDNFYNVARYLEKEDLFNCLLSLLS